MRQPTISLQIIIFSFLIAVLAPLALGSTDFPIPPGRSSNPYTIVEGPDKNLWFVEQGGEKVGRITTAGVITEFPVSGAQSLVGIASGPDGNIWFTDQLTGKVGRMTTSGTGVRLITLPAGSHPQGITTGPDKNLWFVDQKQNELFEIGRMTVTGKLTEFPTNVNAGTFTEYPAAGYGSIAPGPDGNLWFANSQNLLLSQIGRITTTGTITFFPTADFPISVTGGPDGNVYTIETAHVASVTPSGVETECPLSNGGASGITTGPDNNIWFSESNTSLGMVVPGTCTVTEYPSLYPGLYFIPSVVSGPDSALWVVASVSSNIGRVTTSGQLTNTYALSAGSTVGFDAVGPDGNVWFTELAPSLVGNITPTGVITTYPTPTPNSHPGAITAGGDGNVWFIEQSEGQVARVTPEGVMTEFPDSSLFAEVGITEGPDQNVWFTAPFTVQGPSIGRIDPSGNITLFPVLSLSDIPLFIASGPDGNLWFTEEGTNQIGKMDTSGLDLAEYPVTMPNANLSAITSGPDGNLWFVENTSFGAVGKITTSGIVTEYPVQVENFQDGIVAGKDGAIWLAEAYPNSVARITTSGVVSQVPLTTLNAGGNSVTVGADDKLWIPEGYAGAMGRMSAIGGTGSNIKATHEVSFSGTVAGFTDGTPTAVSGDFTASINWGDGSSNTPGTVTGKMGGPFVVKGTHTYENEGSYKLQVSLTDSVDKATYQASASRATVQ